MKNNTNYVDSNEWKLFHKSGKIMTVTIRTIASLMLACTERSRPIAEPDEPTEEKKDTTPPNIRITIPDTTKTYSYDFTIDPTQNTQ